MFFPGEQKSSMVSQQSSASLSGLATTEEYKELTLADFGLDIKSRGRTILSDGVIK